MTESNYSAGAMDASLIRNDTADARNVAQFRSELSGWLRRHFTLDPVRFNDVVLAVNEALTNAAEFAYRGRRGTMTMYARHNAADHKLEVVVSDHGSWRYVDPESRPNTRGRGIPLMQALADRTTISKQPTGTQVRLQFDDCGLLIENACTPSF
ncbi:ATP-binding protein [Mycolicibacterium holsaticum]|jgi:anti-sigma regulatory factor (Ser/Thr protein kinase)|uniref:ATP-binding protein n=1 Tax=Mycolicibacterium holsaticum TaxID=152142 RepID=A0A1E3RPC9_9MYCO|nr:ATP-binding protein [Mycolicibacterium holsaticum]ODQ91755.1 ATP-binding protein [Mycolicibacterium holsaticum]